MTDDSAAHDALTRREYLTYGGAAVVGGLLAGCTGGSGDSGDGSGSNATDDTPADSGGAGTATETGDSADDTAEETTSGGSSYSVRMAPVGKVTFELPPKAWSTYFPGYADMGVALGMADGLQAIGNAERYYTSYYENLNGVSVDKSKLTTLLGETGIGKEVFYEVDADVHLTDPNWLTNNSAFGLESKDIAEIRKNVAPFIGNTIFRRADEWHDYRYYSMYDTFEKIAQVFQREERYRQLKSFHDEYIGRIREQLPPQGQRPNALLVFGDGDQPEEFSPYRLSDKGTNKKQFRDLGVKDTLAGTGIEGLSTTERGTIDYETMLEVDPQTLLIRGHETKTAAEFEQTVLAFMKKHPVASQLSAVENGRVFRGGPIYEGPIQNLFLTERFARDLYPDVYTDGQLFDRKRVAGIINGDS